LIKPTKLKPHFTEETTRDKVKAAQDAWNTHNHELVTQAYAIDSRWRNMIVF
jgi:nuclear transport factor 2 (NTF2) superfamily protein